MKVGDKVKHVKRGWIGVVADFMTRNPGVLVNWSDKTGVMFRWCHRDSLKVIKEL